MMLRALCQSCLRVREFPTWEEREAALCPCGEGPENFCSCEYCSESIALLEQGERRAGPLGLQSHVPDLVDWSAEHGCIEP